MKKHFSLFLLILLILSCQKELKKAANIYQDKKLQQIYTLQDERNTKALIPYLNDISPKYRQAAAIALASVQDSSAIDHLAPLLTDDNEDLRFATAYSLGQIKHKKAESILIKAYQNEKSFKVKSIILESIGKCGTETGLSFLTDMKFQLNEELLLIGQAWGIYRFTLRATNSVDGTNRILEFINADYPDKLRFIASNYLSRTENLDLEASYKQLINAYNENESIFTRMNLVKALDKANLSAVLNFLKSVLVSNCDYRIKVYAINALDGFEYQKVKETLLKQVSEKHTAISISASEYFLKNGIPEDASEYYETALQLLDWRSRTNMLAASFKFHSNKEKIADFIFSSYNAAENKYEKANLLKALAGDLNNYQFIASEVFSGNDIVVRSYGVEALVEIRKSKDFNAVNLTRIAVGNKSMYDEFAVIFKKAIVSGDIALIGFTSNILRDPDMNFKAIYNNTDFLKQALQKCQLPKDIEAYLELQKTIDFFEGTEKTNTAPAMMNNPIDWNLVSAIPVDQQVLIKTIRGDVLVQLMVNEAPGSVSNFIRLIKENFYKTSAIHRVAPNFVIQDGCPRGDGWGGPEFSIRSEFPPLYYDEGSIGMASAGKDTEGSQWFITHSPTPHLDGRYTIFGRVISGMEYVHEIEVGDKILGFEIL